MLASAPCLDNGAPLRIGVLGAARIAPLALINPAKANTEVVVAAVAARDASRAQAFAAKHHIPRVHESYEALIADPDLDAVYNPLPNGLHGTVDPGCTGRRQARAVRKAVHRQRRRSPRDRRTGREVGPGRDGGIPLPLPSAGSARRGDHRLGGVGQARAGGGGPVLPAAEVLRHPLQLLACRRRDNGRRVLCGPHGPHVRRRDTGSRFGTGEIARSSGRPGDDGRVAVCRRAHRPGPLLDVVVAICWRSALTWSATAASCVCSIR